MRRIRRALPAATVLVVDDGSPDGTADIAEKIGKELGQHRGAAPARRSRGWAAPTGPGSGGVSTAGFDVCVEMDADLQHEPEALPDLVAPLAEGHGLVIGSRYVKGGSIPDWTWHRRLLSRGGNIYASILLGLGVTDSTAGFRAYSASVLESIDLDRIRAEGYGFQIEMTYQAKRAGASVVEIPIRFLDRVDGESKMSMFIVVEALGLVTWWGVQRLVEGRTGASTAGAHLTSLGPPRTGLRRAVSGDALASTDRGEGPPIVMLHGQPGSGAGWDPVTHLLEQEFRVLAPGPHGLRSHRRRGRRPR